MDSLTKEMISLHTAESLVGVATESSHPSTGTSAACVGGGAGAVFSAANAAASSPVDLDSHLNQLYTEDIYSSYAQQYSQQQQQQQQIQMQESVMSGQHSSYPSYLNSYEQFYQQQENIDQNSSQLETVQINFNTTSNYLSSDYEQQASGRYDPYLHTPNSGISPSQNYNSGSALDANPQSTTDVSNDSSTVMGENEFDLLKQLADILRSVFGSRSSHIDEDMQQQTTLQQREQPQNGISGQDNYTLTANTHGAYPFPNSGYIGEDMQQHTTLQQREQPQSRMVAQDTYTLVQTSPPQHQQNLMDVPLCIDMQPNNTLQLEPPHVIMEQQVLPDAPIPTTSMVSVMPQQPDTIDTNTQYMPTSNITFDDITFDDITNIQLYPQLHQPASELPPVEHTLTSPPNITSNDHTNAGICILDNFGNLIPASGQLQQVIQTSNGTISAAETANSYQENNPEVYVNAIYKPEDQKEVINQGEEPQRRKRKRTPNTFSSLGPNSAILENGRIKCLECDKEFTKICYLTQHNNSFHCGEYPYRCQKCGKRYQSEDIYTVHLAKHTTTDKAHKCELCPKQFHYKTDLRRHIEAIHTGNKPYCCGICDKSFCRNDHLRKHLETHVKLKLS